VDFQKWGFWIRGEIKKPPLLIIIIIIIIIIIMADIY